MKIVILFLEGTPYREANVYKLRELVHSKGDTAIASFDNATAAIEHAETQGASLLVLDISHLPAGAKELATQKGVPILHAFTNIVPLPE